MKNVLIIGATGLLGSEAVKIMLERGYTVRGLSLPEVPEGFIKHERLELVFANYLTITDAEIDAVFKNIDYFIFAAGIDERIKVKAPALATFVKYNNNPLARFLKAAQKHNVKHAVVLGSYFTYFVRSRPHLELTKHHPYIASREQQLQLALSYKTNTMNVSVLELPYIFGTQPGRKPVWVFLVEMIKKMRPYTFFSKGGTALISAKQVGAAIVNALDQNVTQAYPLATANMTWKELFTVFHETLGTPKKKIVIIPNFIFKIALRSMARKEKRGGFEGGLNLAKFAPMQCSEQFISRELGADLLNVPEDDIVVAIRASVKQSNDALLSKDYGVEMKLNS